MKIQVADLYIRVSTDEQTKGYSPQNQEELLRKYCEINRIQIRSVIHEDFSAKTFNRPEWKRFLIQLKKFKGKSDLVLFTRWDRFSRNAGDAYQMINTLRKLGVEPQAVEQPLDLSIPENKMMLAFYLASPEVENDRRALNTFNGMRRARKEGRYMGVAPVGYINKITEKEVKYIAPDEPNAGIMQWAFEEVATGKFNVEQVFKMAKQKGLPCTRNNFWNALRNPLYYGKIVVPKYKDEPETLVNGKHQALISEALFYQVQEVLDGRKRYYRPKAVTGETLPLRGFLLCPLCGKVLTGSVSKGRTQYYSYYHCSDGCSSRYRAELVNELLQQELEKFVPKPGTMEVFKLAITEGFRDQSRALNDDKKKILAQLDEHQKRLSKARELLLTGDIDPWDYKTMKNDSEKKISTLEAQLSQFASNTENVDKILDKALYNLSRVHILYRDGELADKRHIIGSIFTEKLTFDGTALRTARVNEAAMQMFQIINELEGKKNGTSCKLNNLSRQVPQTGIEPVLPLLETGF